MSVLVVIQARLGSTRLPSKVLLPLGPDQKPVLQHVVERAQRAGYPVVVACPMSDWNALLAPVCATNADLMSEPGDPNDVLRRFAEIVRRRGALWHPPTPIPQIVVRLTADCPCLDYRLIQRAVEAVEGDHDYAGNTVERHWPRGLDVECFTTELLQRAHQEATLPYDREHVTPWMQRHAVSPYSMPIGPEDALGLSERLRWTIDTPNDLTWLQGAFGTLGDPTTVALADYSRLNPPPMD